jgi:hypothetical protein
MIFANRESRTDLGIQISLKWAAVGQFTSTRRRAGAARFVAIRVPPPRVPRRTFTSSTGRARS